VRGASNTSTEAPENQQPAAPPVFFAPPVKQKPDTGVYPNVKESLILFFDYNTFFYRD
jgi:hypothetical protein